MNPFRRLRTLSVTLACAASLLTGCSDDTDSSDEGKGLPMGWIEQEDEQTGVGFALPPPEKGADEEQREGRTTPVVSRNYTSNAGPLLLSVQFLSTPDNPAALDNEVRVDRVPYLLIDQMRTAGPVEVDVLSNQAVDEAGVPTYDARLQLTSGGEEGVWSMRSHELGEAVVVSQVVAIVEGDREEVEAQVATAFERLNDTIDIPESAQ
jgi:hypothetical protein